MADSELSLFLVYSAHALEHFTALKLVGDFTLLVANSLWLTLESRPLGCRAMVKTLCHALVSAHPCPPQDAHRPAGPHDGPVAACVHRAPGLAACLAPKDRRLTPQVAPAGHPLDL